MKIGIRKPSLKKSIKARTTGRAKRAVKSAVNPLYGKKGMGMINDPKKAVYNKVYNKTTVGVGDIARATLDNKGDTTSSNNGDLSNGNGCSTGCLSSIIIGIVMFILILIIF